MIAESSQTVSRPPASASGSVSSTSGVRSSPGYTVDQLRINDPLAWAELRRRCESAVATYCGRSGLGPHETEDIVQAAVMDLFVALKKGAYESQHGSISAYLFGIVRNKLHEHHRKTRRGPAPAPSSSDGVEVLATREERGRWQQSWSGSGLEHTIEIVRASVPPLTWDSFHLTVIRGCPAAVAAEQLETSVLMIYKRAYQVRRQIRDAFEQLSREERHAWNRLPRS